MKRSLLGVAAVVLLVTGCKRNDTSIIYDSAAGTANVQSPTPTPAQPMQATPPKHAPGKFGDTVYTETGLGYIDLKPGTGPTPKNGQKVTVNYTGRLPDGTVFDSNEDPSMGHPQPFSYTQGESQLIQGWVEGVSTMKVGGKRRLIVPPNLGYGPDGAPPRIPGNSTLIFDITLLSAK